MKPASSVRAKWRKRHPRTMSLVNGVGSLRVKDILVSVAGGFVLVLILMSLTSTGLGAVAYALLKPGALIADLAGYGRDDIQGLVLYVGANIMLYAGLSLLVIRAVREWSIR
jgi:hypothetical protein